MAKAVFEWFKKHKDALLVRIIGGLAVAGLLSLLGMLTAWLLGGVRYLKQVAELFNFLLFDCVFPLWVYFAITVVSWVTAMIVLILRDMCFKEKVIKPVAPKKSRASYKLSDLQNPPAYLKYTEDSFFDFNWYWTYHITGEINIDSITPLCPQCGTELEMLEKSAGLHFGCCKCNSLKVKDIYDRHQIKEDVAKLIASEINEKYGERVKSS